LVMLHLVDPSGVEASSASLIFILIPMINGGRYAGRGDYQHYFLRYR